MEGLDLRNIRSPILVFCSKGGNFTPPQQALGWILDLYQASVKSVTWPAHSLCNSQVARPSQNLHFRLVAHKEHQPVFEQYQSSHFAAAGLYEALPSQILRPHKSNLASGRWIMHCETRTLDDIRALGGTTRRRRRFAQQLRFRKSILQCIVHFAQPFVRALVIPGGGTRPAHASAAHPLRTVLGCKPVHRVGWSRGKEASEKRAPASKDNPLVRCRKICRSRL